jgi:hypothetical protein
MYCTCCLYGAGRMDLDGGVNLNRADISYIYPDTHQINPDPHQFARVHSHAPSILSHRGI